MNGHLALNKCLALGVRTVLDVGSGAGFHAKAFSTAGMQVTTIDYKDADIVGDFLTVQAPTADLVWCCHTLEHQLNPNQFLRKCFQSINNNGWFCVTVPPLKHDVVGGHVNLYNAGILLYQMILAGFDCRSAMVKQYGYNISVLVQRRLAILPKLNYDFGDITKLSEFFPLAVTEGFDGRIGDVNWIE